MKYVLVLIAVMFLTACGGGSSGPMPTAPAVSAPLPNVVTPIFTGNCADNIQQAPIYFAQVPNALPDSVQTSAPGAMRPIWDIRYTNPIAPLVGYANRLGYSGIDSVAGVDNPGILKEGDTTAWGSTLSVYDPSGSGVQTSCIGGQLVASAVINVADAQPIPGYNGPIADFGYDFGKYGHDLLTQPKPWAIDGTGNLMIQGYFKHTYQSDPSQIGAEVNINVFLTDPNLPGSLINYVISVARSYPSMTENPRLQATMNTASRSDVYVSTLIQNGTRWVTKSPLSVDTMHTTTQLATAQEWPLFYRVNISYANLAAALMAYPNADIQKTAPSDWTVLQIGLLTETTSAIQVIGTSVRGFSAYMTTSPQ